MAFERSTAAPLNSAMTYDEASWSAARHLATMEFGCGALNSAMTYDEASMVRSKSFVNALQVKDKNIGSRKI